MSLASFSSFNDLHILFMVTKPTFQLFSQCFETVKAFFSHVFESNLVTLHIYLTKFFILKVYLPTNHIHPFLVER